MLSSTTLLCSLALTSATGWAQYTLQQDFMQGGNFLSQFSFWDTADPTNGFVQYLSQPEAEMAGLINATSNQITLAADSSETTTVGRKSIRITSNLSFDSGLVILDLAHMPGSICGSWPAFWTVGPNWPNQGEIDIIEGVNTNTQNAMTLHTGEGCTINNSGGSDVFSGTVNTNNCDIDAPNQATNAGCSIDATSSNTYGTGFNNAGGGVYAMELTSSGIAIYFFSRDNLPSDINSDSPDPSGWGTPLSAFQGDCDFPSKFTNQQIVFDTTFCGDWAGAVWPSSSCAAQYGSSCENFVGQNPSAFAESYWTINSLKLFSGNGAVGGGGGSGNGGGASSSPQTTFATATSGWPAGGSPPAGSPPGGHRPGHFHHHGGSPASSASVPGWTPHDGSVPPQATPTAATNSPAQASSPAQTSSLSPPASSPAPQQGGGGSPPPPPPQQSAQPTPQSSQQGPEGLSSPAAASHTWQWGHGSNNNGGGRPSAYSSQSNVEAMTASVSQNVAGSSPAAAAYVVTSSASSPSPSRPALAAERSQGAGVYGVVSPLRRDRERHLKMHRGRRGF